ncbi:TPA: hypothetical protein F3L15_15600 [Aeromonas hydrophila]|uniref:hypothetical protein n=1 Tax=Aeromonas hydrophila TaxID=644 RepID=UPI0005CE934B|nr:hypothetical protein [Aeromonas hydrophila]AJQ54010.1 hypothetical protein RY45_07925 [Aeromonas hydrophila]TNH84433.1 hypothetical protein CF139_17565 [Aeromonas hydrophila]HAU4885431.1 hypothetical protein [Aeromonas hydrophila]
MKRVAVAVVSSALIFGCVKHELVSVDGKDTNRWEIVKDWNGQKGWIGASYHDGESAVSYEALNDDRALTYVSFNATKCEDELVVDRQRFIAKSTKKQKAGYTACYVQVFGVDALNIANKMATADAINLNGHDVDVRGFDSIMSNYFAAGSSQEDAFGDRLNALAGTDGQSTSVTKHGNWVATQSGDILTAGLKSVSAANASIMIAGNKSKAVFTFLEMDQPDYADCKSGLSIENEDFTPRVDALSQDGKRVCSYIIEGQEAQYVLSLIGSKKTIYVDGVVFETDGYDSLKDKLPN